MAKRAAVNKSALIREALASNKGKAPSEIAAMLNAEHGLKLSGQYVSTIKSNSAKKRGRRGGRHRVAKGHERGIGFAAVPAALEFIKSAGGLDQAKATLGQLEEIGKVL